MYMHMNEALSALHFSDELEAHDSPGTTTTCRSDKIRRIITRSENHIRVKWKAVLRYLSKAMCNPPIGLQPLSLLPPCFSVPLLASYSGIESCPERDCQVVIHQFHWRQRHEWAYSLRPS